MRWLERLRTLEKNSDFSAGELQKPQEGAFCSFYSPSPQECEVSRGLEPRDLPAEWTAGVACMEAMVCPGRMRPERWRQAIFDAHQFLARWGAQAAALGWSTLDVFGAHPTRPVERLDCAGLIILLHGDELLAFTADTARTRRRNGAILTYYRRPRPEAVPLWELG